MSKYHYPILSYFLQAYWNQNGDIMYGDTEAAARDFVKLENNDYCDNLLMEIELALDSGLIQPNMDWDSCSKWWSQHDTFINIEEASAILTVLKRRSKSGYDS
jgi:hypothetical protein